jgi:hypothetical protein
MVGKNAFYIINIKKKKNQCTVEWWKKWPLHHQHKEKQK